MTYQTIYSLAQEFLISQKGIKAEILEKHFSPEYNKPDSFQPIFKRLINSSQNTQMSPNVIGKAVRGVDNFAKVTDGFDPKKTAEKYTKAQHLELFEEIRLQLEPKGKLRTEPRSLWPRFCKSLIDSAHFLKRFETPSDFYKWANFFADDPSAKLALPILLSLEIRGISFPLACDFLKEIGYTGYGKPDVQIINIFSSIGLIPFKKNPSLSYQVETFRIIERIAEANGVTPFIVDRIFWLIGSGYFFNQKDLDLGDMKAEFKEFILKKKS